LVFNAAAQSILDGNSVKYPPQKKDDIQPLYHTVLLVPFEDQMYMSDADDDIAQGSALKDERSIKNRFRDGLMISLTAGSKLRYKAIALDARDTAKQSDLYKAYSAIKYKYEEVPKTGEEKKTNSLFTVSNDKPGGTSVEKGQIVSREDHLEKYMKTIVKKQDVLDYLFKKYNADLFLFISQFEIKNDVSDLSGFAYGDFKREARVHYTFYDKNGNFVSGGIAEVAFSSQIKDINQIVSGNFSDLAGQVFSAIFQKEKENEEKQEAQKAIEKIEPEGDKDE